LRRHPLDVRHHHRKKTRAPAWISYGGELDADPLRAVGRLGRRRPHHGRAFQHPARHVLLILNRATKAHRFCQVVWRRQPHIGIKFVDPAEGRVVPRPQLADPNRLGYGIGSQS
jgi:hypothetical protein